MSSAKTERLINLTMALLGAKRYMTKTEIFRKVAGYSGSAETMERMFERDKDELRSLGIEIDLVNNDPLFEDEIGYRISPDRFSLKPVFSPEELGILATALNLMGNSSFAEDVTRLNLKIDPLIASHENEININVDNSLLLSSELKVISEAISTRTELLFDYKKGLDVNPEKRSVYPMGLSAWRGEWYLVGFDKDRDDIRVFKLSRISSEINLIGKKGSFEIDPDFNVRDHVIMFTSSQYPVTLQVRRFTGYSLRERAQRVESINDDFDLVTIDFMDENDALKSILWFGDDIVVLEPEDLKSKVINALKRIVAAHE